MIIVFRRRADAKLERYAPAHTDRAALRLVQNCLDDPSTREIQVHRKPPTKH